MKRALQQILERWPTLALPLRSALQDATGRSEPELRLLPLLVPSRGLAVDVGANRGIYTWKLSRLCDHVLAVEANSAHLPYLRTIAPERVRVLHAAMSDRAGVVEMRVPSNEKHASGLGTIEPSNPLRGSVDENQMVNAMRLDDVLPVEDIVFLKIDVEGHELAVLKGAANLLKRSHPTILVEAEERHRPNAVASVCAFLANFGYHGLMLEDGQLRSTDQYDPARHQELCVSSIRELEAGRRPLGYVNNFIFF